MQPKYSANPRKNAKGEKKITISENQIDSKGLLKILKTKSENFVTTTEEIREMLNGIGVKVQITELMGSESLTKRNKSHTLLISLLNQYDPEWYWLNCMNTKVS